MTIQLTEEEISDIKDALRIAIKLAQVMESNIPTDRWQALVNRFEPTSTTDTPPL